MPEYRSPGIYVEEISSGPRPIEPAGTSTAGFVGKAPLRDAEKHKAVAINNWSHFERVFIGDADKTTALAQAVFGYFDNGGRRCYVVNVGDDPVTGGRGRKGIDVLEEIDEVAMVAAPGYTDAASFDALLSHCEKLKDRVAILDAPRQVTDLGALTKEAKPDAKPAARAEGAPAGGAAAPAAGGGVVGARPRASDAGYGAFYFPWLVTRNVLDPRATEECPPSGHIAGIYARTDATRGVHKAPANEVVRGALDLTYPVTDAEQAELNPNGVNCLRAFSRRGIRVWGARTLSGPGTEWVYVNVRRLFCMLEESIATSTHWVVFEPNDPSLWKRIIRDVSAFLTLMWRAGYLVGATPEEAFFVKCDEETNPPEVVNAGQVRTLIGVAPARPAEFVVFQIGQHQGGAVVEEAKP